MLTRLAAPSRGIRNQRLPQARRHQPIGASQTWGERVFCGAVQHECPSVKNLPRFPKLRRRGFERALHEGVGCALIVVWVGCLGRSNPRAREAPQCLVEGVPRFAIGLVAGQLARQCDVERQLGHCRFHRFP
jgi:hypothetical protein